MTMTSSPTMSAIGDVYILSWEKENIKIKIDRLSERSEGVTAELLATCSGKHLYSARFNLLSPHSKKIIANELARRLNGIGWDIMIEQVCVHTLTQYRRGEPVITVGNLPRRNRPRYRLKPFILENQLSALYGHGGSSKTQLALLCAIMVQCGVSLLGFSVIQGNSLLLDWETSAETIDEKVKAIKKGMNIDSPAIPFYRRCFHLLTHDITEIQREVIEKQIELVIIDSAGMAGGFDKDYHSVAIELLRALRSLNISVLLIDHKPKVGDSMFGSVYKYNECRSAFEIKVNQEAGSNCMDIALFHTKYNDTAKHKPMGFHIEFEGDEDYTEAIIFTQKDVTEMPELEARLSYRERIINFLKQGAVPINQIAEELNIPEASIRTTLYRNKKTFVKTEGGWGLLLNEP